MCRDDMYTYETVTQDFHRFFMDKSNIDVYRYDMYTHETEKRDFYLNGA